MYNTKLPIKGLVQLQKSNTVSRNDLLLLMMLLANLRLTLHLFAVKHPMIPAIKILALKKK